MGITFNFPINSVSFGQTAIAILREAYKSNLECCIIPIGNVDFSAQKPDPDFEKWVNAKIIRSFTHHTRKNRTIKLWHINGGWEAPSEHIELITFHETDSVTSAEVNILSSLQKVWVTSSFTKQVFEENGLTNVSYLPLGLDVWNIHNTNKKYYPDNIKVIGLGGKWEHRKHTVKILRLLSQYIGNNPNIYVHAAIYNPFFSKEQNEKFIFDAMQGQKYFNFNFLPFMAKNSEYNDFLNSCDVFLGLSGGEGKDLPVYQAASLGKKIVGLNAHAYTDYLNHNNSFLVEPNGKVPCYDGIFFHQGQFFNQGNFYTWDANKVLETIFTALKSPPKEPFKYTDYSLTYNTLINA